MQSQETNEQQQARVRMLEDSASASHRISQVTGHVQTTRHRADTWQIRDEVTEGARKNAALQTLLAQRRLLDER